MLSWKHVLYVKSLGGKISTTVLTSLLRMLVLMHVHLRRKGCLRYFPLTPRLQRIYMSARVSSDMRWHAEGLAKDGKMRHPADSKAWKHVDSKYEWFACDAHNIRLCLTSDGFNLFGMPNVTYTCWQVILIPYNLPPWLCHKQP